MTVEARRTIEKLDAVVKKLSSPANRIGTFLVGQSSDTALIVVGGSYVVGLVVFLILVVINFAVITKGAGRIAEVAARFTLDAMPGKQLAIDADMNSGLITEKEARARRRAVEEEADFYGAMDGASKFVRGDAVAGLIITGINIVGGFVIGVVQHGLSAGQAADTPPSPREADPEAVFAFVRDVGDAILPAYVPIVERRRGDAWGDRERRWQTLRRGRYVEFNLLYDRGTVFGLRTDGRVESILMSLPPEVRWEYAFAPEPGTPEAESLAAIVAKRDWANTQP